MPFINILWDELVQNFIDFNSNIPMIDSWKNEALKVMFMALKDLRGILLNIESKLDKKEL